MCSGDMARPDIGTVMVILVNDTETLFLSLSLAGIDVSNIELVATSAGGIEIPRGSNKSSNGGLQGGSIAGVVVGVVIAALLILGEPSDRLSYIFSLG